MVLLNLGLKKLYRWWIKSIFGYVGSYELMISSIRPFSSDWFFLFDLESLNENCGAGESKDTHPCIYIGLEAQTEDEDEDEDMSEDKRVVS